jgi:hypothetical protein
VLRFQLRQKIANSGREVRRDPHILFLRQYSATCKVASKMLIFVCIASGSLRARSPQGADFGRSYSKHSRSLDEDCSSARDADR